MHWIIIYSDGNTESIVGYIGIKPLFFRNEYHKQLSIFIGKAFQ